MGSKEEIKTCYSIEDNEAALDCLKQVAKKSNGEECRPRLVLLVQENCGGCEEEKARFKKDIEDGTVVKIDINTPEGREIANRNKIEAVPAVLLLDCKNVLIDDA